MTEKEKIGLIEEMLDLDDGTLTKETVLSTIKEWDSISLISFIALMDDEFGKIVKGSEVKQQNTVADLLAMMEE